MKYCKLTDVCNFQGGSQPPKSDWILEPKDGYIRMLQIRDFTQNYDKPEYVKITNSIKTCKKEDILIARYGASVGKILTGLDGAYNVAIMKIIPNEKILLKKYLFYFLNSNLFQNHILNVGSRAAQAGFNKEDLNGINIQIHSVEDQEKIIYQLENLDNLIDIRKMEIEKFNNLIKSQFVEMFGDININSHNYQEEKLSNHLKIIGGYAFKSKNFKNKGIPVLRIGNINTGFFVSKNLMFYDDNPNLENYAIYPGDVVISLTGTVGKDDYGNVCIVGNEYDKYYLNQRNAKLELNNTVNSRYITYAFRIPEIKKRLTTVSRGVRQANISNKDIENLVIPIPLIDLQNKFADIVKQIDKQKFEFENSLKKLEELKNSLMQEYFG